MRDRKKRQREEIKDTKQTPLKHHEAAGLLGITETTRKTHVSSPAFLNVQVKHGHCFNKCHMPANQQAQKQ